MLIQPVSGSDLKAAARRNNDMFLERYLRSLPEHKATAPRASQSHH